MRTSAPAAEAGCPSEGDPMSADDVSRLAAAVLAAPPLLGPVRLVCGDGPAGAGKTTLAAALADRLAVAGAVVGVVHLDDLYEGWAGLDAVWDRVEGQVLAPLAAGRPARYRRFDWGAGRFGERVELPVPQVLVLEGCGSAPRAVDGRAALRIFVDAPADVRLARGVARDGEHLRAEWVRWQVAEQRVFARESTRSRADVVVDGVSQDGAS